MQRIKEKGFVSSCGCRKKELSQTKAAKYKRKYDRKVSILGHASFKKMKERCLNPNSNSYENYGARGIKVCDRWLEKKNGWKNFFQDMGTRPSSKHTIDRIDNNKDYTPENCRWATWQEQSNNKDDNVFHKGYSTHELAQITGLTYYTVIGRLKRKWTIEEILEGKRKK